MHKHFLALSMTLCLGTFAMGQTSYPMITHGTPTAVQRGKTTDVIIEGQMNFEGIHTALIEGTGITAEVIALPAMPPAKAATAPVVRSVKVKVTVAPDAVCGVREFRLASKLGISTLGQLVVSADPVMQETGDNNTQAKAQAITVPSVICGRVELVEDVDWFRFKATKGQTLTFDMLCARLQDKIHDLQKHADPVLILLDSEGRELASNDDFNFADPLLTHTFAQDGEYFLQIRDTKYDGDPRWAYAVQVTAKPYATHMFPFALNPGKSAKVELVGAAKKSATSVEVVAPKTSGITSIPLKVGDAETNPVPAVITSLPLMNETEPNDTPDKANKLQIPGGVNGRIGVKRELDHFAFRGTKGKTIRFEVFARRFNSVLNSHLDSMLEILNPQGAVLASNDDTNGKDALVLFTPPADGDYIVRLRDLNNKGGETFVYYLEADWARPDFTVKCDPSKAMVGPGSRTAWYVQVARTNGFAGPVKVEVSGLPKHMTVNPLVIPPTMTQGLLVVSASPDATTPSASIVKITGSAELLGDDGKPTMVTRESTAVEEIYSPGGGRARLDVRMQAVAVTAPTDILDVQVKPNRITIKPGEEVRLDITVVRRADFDKSISLDIPLRHLGTVFGNPLPPGVTIVEAKSKTLIGTGNVGHIVLKADATAAPLTDVPICVLAHVSINFVVKVSYASEAIPLTVGK